MFSLFKSLTVREFLVIEGPSLATSFVLAELLYKFHSFTLECLAFLVTWSVLGAAVRCLTAAAPWAQPRA